MCSLASVPERGGPCRDLSRRGIQWACAVGRRMEASTHMEWLEGARGGSYEGLCQGRAVPTCFEMMVFQVLEGMPGWQVEI